MCKIMMQFHEMISTCHIAFSNYLVHTPSVMHFSAFILSWFMLYNIVAVYSYMYSNK